MAEQQQSAINIEETWITRTERFDRRLFVGVQNALPQSYEDEQRLFATVKSRKEEIGDRSADENTYMIIHDNGSKMTVAFKVDRAAELPPDMVLWNCRKKNMKSFASRRSVYARSGNISATSVISGNMAST